MVEQFGLVLRVQTVGTLERLCVPISEQADSILFPLVQQLPINLSQKDVGFNPYSINLVFCGNSLKILVVVVCGSRGLGLLIVFCLLYTDILISMWEKLCGVLLAKHHFYILT